MSRIAIIVYHEGADKTIPFSDNAKDTTMLEYALKLHGPAHRIKQVHLCTEDSVHVNESPIVAWIKTTKRLTS